MNSTRDMAQAPGPTLAMPAEVWEVELRDGTILRVLANSVALQGADVVYTCSAGTPPFLLETLPMPSALLAPGYNITRDEPSAED